MAKECGEIKEFTHAVLDGELDAEGRARFDAHLKACPACRRRYEALSRAVTVLAAAPRLEPSPTFVADVVRRARLAEAREVKAGRVLSWVTAAAAAAVGAGALAFFVGVLKPALSYAAGRLVGDLATAPVDVWKVARATAPLAEGVGKVVSALGASGSYLAREVIQSSSPVYLGAFVAIALFYLVWRGGSRMVPLHLRTV